MRALALILCLVGVLIQDCVAQRSLKKFKFSRIEANTKLSNSNITTIFQDTQGFLWVGTDDGLNRFDGYDFKIYRTIENDTASLVKNKIQSVFEDSRGTLWVSTLNSGLHVYDRSTDRFLRISEFSKQHCQVMRIMEDTSHHLWIGGVIQSEAFVARLDNETHEWKTFLLFPSTDPIYSMVQFSDDEFLLGTRLNGLFRWNQKTLTLVQSRNELSNPSSLPGNYIERMLKDPKGNIWIATRSGLSKYDPRNGKYKNYVASQAGAGLPVNDIMDICLDDEALWIATENGGLSRMDTRTEKFTNFLFDKYDPTSIVNNSIWSLHKDRQGRIWIGSYAKGLCVFDNIEEKFSELDLPLENDLVNAIVKDSHDRLWIGTEEGLLLLENNSTRHFKHDPNNPRSLSTNAVNCIYEDNQHRIWTGNWNGGINRYDEDTQSFVRYLPDPKRKDCLGNPNVFAITQNTKTAELLVCTFNGVYILKDEKKGIFDNAVDTRHEGDQLLIAALVDKDNNIWIGSYNGLSLFHPETKSFERFYLTKDSVQISDRVTCIYEDHKGQLWIGTFAGLHQKTGPTNFTSYTTHDGLPVNIVQGILEDSKGNLWLGTTHGLSFIDPQTKLIKTFDESDGLLTSEFRRKAFFRSPEGRLFVGGKGVNTFFPDSIKTNPNRPPVFITDLKIFNQSVTPSDNINVLKNSILETKEIFLTSSKRFSPSIMLGLTTRPVTKINMPTNWMGLIMSGIMLVVNDSPPLPISTQAFTHFM